ncbi:NDP-hexose 2,3-dehydratase family protein [Streptomyces sp. HB132]|uniref:NDP-hexose 2,3-dehydratase family protein n=1 Tax=Streptomyces sp. HB132 TaxID=767388 RepID=UPI00196217BF|nr:NDP-hexose 2,3-dehydratase family protein [Streptomyces sp. HB132]MBM7442934.1 oxidase EvaA [Streptomyces sp. HB132]
MTHTSLESPSALHTQDSELSMRIARSLWAADSTAASLQSFHSWFTGLRDSDASHVRRIDFDALTDWRFEAATGNIVHDSGKFFSIEGLNVRATQGPTQHQWSQPIISQPEIGLLGILVKEFDGTLHCLMQAKMEPGNCNGLQLSPTVQATRSNYTGVHGGKSVPYLDYFLDAPSQHVITDVLQSEQGSWFYRKRNRNIIVEVNEPVEVLEGFCWLSIGQLHELLSIDDLVNMDARTVLSCLPLSGAGLSKAHPFEGETFRSALVRSLSADQGTLRTSRQVQNWITDARVHSEMDATPVGLGQIEGWRRSSDRISHEAGLFFDVMAVDVRAGSREVRSWTQPMIEARNRGVVAFLTQRIEGVLHVLANVRAEPGLLDMVEVAPTLQCTPEDYQGMPAKARPPFMDEVLQAPRESIRFDTVLSEEGGRFFHTRNRYLIVEADPARDLTAPADFCWLTVHQLTDLIQHSHYVNIQARSLTACLHSLTLRPMGN